MYELFYSVIFQRSRSDFPEYFLHHLMTWSLIFFSYSLNMLPMGSIVMLVHDVTDLTVTLFKLTVDVTHFIVQIITYASLLSSWIYFRIWFFPCYIIYKLYEECYGPGKVCKNVNYSMLNMMFAFISGLACLHVFWLYLLLKGLFGRLKSKNWKDEVSIGSSVNRDAMEGSKNDNWTTKRETKWIDMIKFTNLAYIIKDIIGKKSIIESDSREILQIGQ